MGISNDSHFIPKYFSIWERLKIGYSYLPIAGGPVNLGLIGVVPGKESQGGVSRIGARGRFSLYFSPKMHTFAALKESASKAV